MTLQGFRSFRDTTSVRLGPFATIVGKNDTGKSSILHALNAFFNGVLDEADFNRDQSLDEPITIQVCFADLPETIQLEEGIDTTLAEENLLDEDCNVTLKRIYTKKTIKKPKSVLVTHDYLDREYQNLCSLKEAQLNDKGRSLGLDFKKSGAGVTNKSKRQAIREEAARRQKVKGRVELEPGEALLKLFEYLPEFDLFPADFRLSEEDTAFQKEFKAVVETAVSSIPGRSDIEKGIEEEIDNEIAKIHGFLLQHTDEVTSIKAKPSFKWKDLVSFYLECKDKQGKSIAFGKRGSGLRRLLMVAYFQYVAQRGSVADSPKAQIYAIEEPETYLHPGAQRILLKSFEDIATSHQVIVSSHSPVFGGSTDLANLALVSRENGVTRVHQIPELDLLMVTQELGIDPSDQIFGFKACVFVEGDGDIEFLEAVAMLLKGAGKVGSTFPESGVGLLALGGADNLRHWITRKTMKRVNRRFGVLIDSDKKDPGHSVPQRKLNWKVACEAEGGTVFITRKREIENYLHPQAINRDRGKADPFDDFTDMKALFGENVIKAVKKMTVGELLERDFHIENGEEHHEILEIIEKFLSLAG